MDNITKLLIKKHALSVLKNMLKKRKPENTPRHETYKNSVFLDPNSLESYSISIEIRCFLREKVFPDIIFFDPTINREEVDSTISEIMNHIFSKITRFMNGDEEIEFLEENIKEIEELMEKMVEK